MRTAQEMVDFCNENKFYFAPGENPIQHFAVAESSLMPDEDVRLTFVSNGVVNRGECVVGGTVVILLTTKRCIYAQKRVIMGDFTKIVSYDNINDIHKKKGWFFGEISIDTIREELTFSVNKESVDNITNSIMQVIDEYKKQSNSVNAQVAQISAADELKKFKELLDSGVITQGEFDAKKKQLLNM